MILSSFFFNITLYIFFYKDVIISIYVIIMTDVREHLLRIGNGEGDYRCVAVKRDGRYLGITIGYADGRARTFFSLFFWSVKLSRVTCTVPVHW